MKQWLHTVADNPIPLQPTNAHIWSSDSVSCMRSDSAGGASGSPPGKSKKGGKGWEGWGGNKGKGRKGKERGRGKGYGHGGWGRGWDWYDGGWGCGGQEEGWYPKGGYEDEQWDWGPEESRTNWGEGRTGYKRRLCFNWQAGHCTYGSRCRYAHESWTQDGDAGDRVRQGYSKPWAPASKQEPVGHFSSSSSMAETPHTTREPCGPGLGQTRHGPSRGSSPESWLDTGSEGSSHSGSTSTADSTSSSGSEFACRRRKVTKPASHPRAQAHKTRPHQGNAAAPPRREDALPAGIADKAQGHVSASSEAMSWDSTRRVQRSSEASSGKREAINGTEVCQGEGQGEQRAHNDGSGAESQLQGSGAAEARWPNPGRSMPLEDGAKEDGGRRCWENQKDDEPHEDGPTNWEAACDMLHSQVRQYFELWQEEQYKVCHVLNESYSGS